MSAIAATSINSPNVVIGFDQNGQAWVWGESSKIQLQSTSIRKNRPSLKEEIIYPFKVVATWNTPLFIAQAGDRPSTQLSTLKVLAFGNRGKNKQDFILLQEISTDQYRLTTKEGDRQLQFESPDFLTFFKTKGKYYGDDFFGILLTEEQDWNDSDIVTTINGNTTIKTTPNGGYYFISTTNITGSTQYDPPVSSLRSPPLETDFFGNPSRSRRGYKPISMTQYPLPDPFYIPDLNSIATPEERAAWNQAIQACVNTVSTEILPPEPIVGGGQTNRFYTYLNEKNTNRRKCLLSGSLDSISKNTAIENSEKTEDSSNSGQYEVTPILTLELGSVSGGSCKYNIAWIWVTGAYYEYLRPYYEVFDKHIENRLKIDDDAFALAYTNSIPININTFNSIDYTINSTYNTTTTVNDTFTETNVSGSTQLIETIETRQSTTIINNKVTGLYKGNDELCLYAKTDNSTFIVNGNRTSIYDSTIILQNDKGQFYTPTISNFSGGLETNENIEPESIYLADKENVISFEKNYFYLRVSNIKNIINLSQLVSPFNFDIESFSLAEYKGLFYLYFDYPVKYTYDRIVTGNTITSTNINLISSHSDEYHLVPNFNYPLELIIFDEENIYKLLGTISFTYNVTPTNYPVKNVFNPASSFGSFSYSTASLASASITITDYQLIKYHALKGLDTNTFGHIYSSNNCLGLFQKLLGDNFDRQSGVSRANLYRRKNNQIILAFSDNSNLTKRGERYADLYRLENNKFIREGEKKGSYYPVINSSTQNSPNSAFISYQD
ncbi:MAG: hypothetical protein GPJ00_16305 [Microcystis aeruginosa W13-18]|nr:hypothetical protein [Microcystis aeruginosa W13-18]NCR36830.1 hypothetical protein [Microcystis aeruginosa S11-05]NCR50336.1 hypothetical protein [Microcystis aeruginosa S11-01]